MDSRKKPDDSWTTFALSIFRLHGLIMQVGEDIVRPIGQSSARWQVLGRAFEPQTVAAMARGAGLARQSVQRVANALAREGLVVYKNHPTDRRTRLLELTPQGMEALTAIYTRQMEWSKRVMPKLDQKRLADTVSGLESIGRVLETEINVSKE